MSEEYVEDYIQLPPDGVGKKVRAIKRPDNRYEEVTIPLSKDGKIDIATLSDLLDKLSKALASIATDSILTSGSEKKPYAQRPATHDLYVQLRHGGAEIDPREIRALTKTDVVTVIQQAIERTLVEQGTWHPFRVAPTAPPEEVTVLTPTAGKKLQILSFIYYCDADIITELRFKTSDNLVGGLPTKGVVGFNQIGRKPATGNIDEPLVMYFSASANAVGWVTYREI